MANEPSNNLRKMVDSLHNILKSKDGDIVECYYLGNPMEKKSLTIEDEDERNSTARSWLYQLNRLLDRDFKKQTLSEGCGSCEPLRNSLHILTQCGTLMPHDDTSNKCITQVIYDYKECKDKLNRCISRSYEVSKRNTTPKVDVCNTMKEGTCKTECKDGLCKVVCKSGSVCKTSFRWDSEGCRDEPGSSSCTDTGMCDYDSGRCEADTSFFN